MGAVFLAHNVLSTKMRAAVKVLKPHSLGDARERFIREVELLASVQHPAVVRVLGGGEDDSRGLLYMAMEYLEGEELKQRLNRGPLSFEEASRLFQQLGSGLLAAHRLGVVHRDIKPQNIWICEDGSGKLLDFGIAVQDGSARLTRAGAVPGTIAYMPPEVFQGKRPDHRADIYALGLVLWEALTGREAFPEDATTSEKQAMVQIMGQKLQSEPMDPGEAVPSAVRDLVRRATAPEPSVRLSDLEAFVYILRQGHDAPIHVTFQVEPTADIPAPEPAETAGPVTEAAAEPTSTSDASASSGRGLALIGASVMGLFIVIFGMAAVIIGVAAILVAQTSRAPQPATQSSTPQFPVNAPAYAPPKQAVPEGFPWDVPSEALIVSGQVNQTGSSEVWVVSFTVDEAPETLVGKYSSDFKAAGLTVSLTRSTAANGTTATVVGFSQESQNVAVVAPPVSYYGDGPFVTLTHTPRQ